ncbi:hypothetical protein [Paraburkholderia sp. GAS348]|uniref:hypothetical protein n=1 Tax=Paraburkholderia sp. GAS348 TaxID=3035132 RepID=UPI003D261247
MGVAGVGADTAGADDETGADAESGGLFELPPPPPPQAETNIAHTPIASAVATFNVIFVLV